MQTLALTHTHYMERSFYTIPAVCARIRDGDFGYVRAR
ncbi:hypothetical protein BX257_0303 [Streptomyces sp. 3212.3]|jgi:hypothetical protein|nr:hypothetical protein BX257_0303 [Streptomyces sp. 3212.3]